MAGAPSVSLVLDAARVAREAGNLHVAARAVDHAYQRLDDEPGARERLAEEGALFARELAERGAHFAALGELLRAQQVGADLRDLLSSLLRTYTRWRPRAASIGVPKDALTAGASGDFWVGIGRRGRILLLEGGITGEATEAVSRVIELSAEKAPWLFVDVSRLSYVGSSGLAVIVKQAERCKGKGGGLCLFGLSSNLKLLVETLGLAPFLNPVADLPEALSLAQPSLAPAR